MTLEAPYGNVTLDENRQGIIDTYVQQLVLDERRRGRPADRRHHPGGRPDLRRHVRPRHAAAVDARIRRARRATCRGSATRSRSSTAFRRRGTRQRPQARADGHGAGWHRAGGTETTAAHDDTATTTRSRRASRPSSSCAMSSSPSVVCSPWAASTSMSPGASGSPCSAPTAPARPRCSTSSPATCTPPAARSSINGVDCTTAPSRRRPELGVARTYQKTRLFPGLTVEDNLYLAWIGKHGRHRRCAAPALDEALARRGP